jgi:endonuclease/exonuclease/phosphatase family metal-dependent hydrolase
VATLNIWNKAGPWPKRLPLIRAELKTLAADVVGLQEVLRLAAPGIAGGSAEAPTDQAAEVAQGLGYQWRFGPASDYGNGLQFGNAVLSRYPFLEQRCFELPGKESGETRSVLYTLLESPAGPLPVFVTHLNWKLHHGSIRLRQVQFIAERIAELAPIDTEALPPVLMGDLNAEPDSDEIRYLRGLHTFEGKSVYFADAWIYGGDGGLGATFDRINRFAALAHEPPRRIDYIFVRGPDRRLRGEPTRTHLAFCAAAEIDGEPIWPSDHFGVFSEVTLEGEQG